MNRIVITFTNGQRSTWERSENSITGLYVEFRGGFAVVLDNDGKMIAFPAHLVAHVETYPYRDEHPSK